MKLSDAHADRIEALSGLQSLLADTMGEETATVVIETTQKLARMLIETAAETDDPGRLTAAIDSLRAALEATIQATDVGNAKKRRLNRDGSAQPYNQGYYASALVNAKSDGEAQALNQGYYTSALVDASKN